MDIVLHNKTKIPNWKIKEIIRFVSPRGIKIPPITLRMIKSGEFSGVYYYTKSGRKIRGSITGASDKYPQFIIRDSRARRQGYLSDFWLLSREEAIVYLLAHELRHAWQEQYLEEPRWGDKFTDRPFSERDTDTYALWKLENWRKKKKKIRKLKSQRPVQEKSPKNFYVSYRKFRKVGT